ncbi:SMI1/KNR4 family protein [Sphingomonas kyeonggiensis]|uniref:Knr4/Smi1-like domain-containing protein n=1 Tax=Sphingomonas kyeonggiensis TaxID=1268553 RepID=A0A7W6JVV4_9SPHN|nr:SMI1/KNR4 family protein [Sphingomonas kyeonggiensis]MBB4100480.1 hypothetical protein [Sphingomonas kyeonggiensis]
MAEDGCEGDLWPFLKSSLGRYVGNMSLSRFTTLWTHPDYAPGPVSEIELESAEGCLDTRLPADYRTAVREVGLPRPTTALLDAIVDRELDLRDVSEFLSPVEIVSITEDWRDLGLPEELIAFATDCMGNLFCFPATVGAGALAPVVFFDHDSRTVDVIAPSFTRWIEEFCRVAPH